MLAFFLSHEELSWANIRIRGKFPGAVSGSSLIGASERDSVAAGCPWVLGRERAAVQADGCAQRLERTSQKAPLCCRHTPWQQIVAQEGAAPAFPFGALRFPIEWDLCLRTG